MVAEITNKTVGFVRGRYGFQDAFDDVINTYSIDGVEFDDRRAFREAPAETVDRIDYLVVEAGDADHEPGTILEGAAFERPVLYVHEDPERLKEAMTSWANVVLVPDNVDQLGKRLESLHIGAETEPVSNGIGVDEQEHLPDAAYRTLMEEFRDLIYVFDRHGRFIEVNAAKAESLDETAESMVGKSDFDHFQASTALEVYQDTLEVMEGTRHLENKPEWIEGPDGEKMRVTASKHPVENEDGLVIGQIGISREITELTRQQMMVERIKDVLKYLYETYDHNFRNRSQAQIGVTTKTRDGVEAARAGLEALDELDEAIDSAAERLQGGSGGDPRPGQLPERGAAPRQVGEVDSMAELRESCTEVRALMDETLRCFSAARAEGNEMVDELHGLIGDFSELISVVKVSGEVTDISIGTVAQRAFVNEIHHDEITVTADTYKTRAIFEQLNEEIGSMSEVTVRSTDTGFTIEVPAAVDVPKLGRRFKDQDLREGSKPALKIGLLAATQGWTIRSERLDDGGTVLDFDVTAWKREMGAVD